MKEKLKNCSSVGGQAVIEGVMMKGKTSMVTAVRDNEGKIRVEKKRVKPLKERNRILKMPIVRGVVSFIFSLFGGAQVLMRSAEIFAEETDKFNSNLKKSSKINAISVVSFFSVLLGLALALFLFIWLPVNATHYLQKWTGAVFSVWAKNFIEGGIKLLVFIGYILFCTCLKDIRRVFMYHGAEHKTINCYEKGLDVTVENAKSCSRVHPRCGTTFLVFVMFISIILFAVLESVLSIYGVKLGKVLRILFKIALVPLVAGISYELLKLLAKTTSPIVLPLKLPGFLLQKITTKEPDDKMLEVAITAFKGAMEMDEDKTIKEQDFSCGKTRKQVLEVVKNCLNDNGITEPSEAEWLVSLSLGVKRGEIFFDIEVTIPELNKIKQVLSERLTGKPLWYCIGTVDFYGFTLKVDDRVLIPRPETELLVENALKCVKQNSTVLDLCTGSGAIGIAVNKISGANVIAVDISEKALNLAKENAKLNGANVKFIKSDLFSSIPNDSAHKFDVIISNPPYIKSKDIETLQKEVKDFEPLIALDGGNDGLDFYRIIALKAKEYLNENGVLLLECGMGQAESIKKLLFSVKSVEIIKDYSGIDRIIKAVF